MAAISAEQVTKINAIMEQLDFRNEAKDVENRRRAARLNVRMALNVFLTGNGSAGVGMEIFTRNLSSSGMGFVSRRLFKQDERIVIDFNVKGFPARLILARVTHGRYCSAGLHEIGAEFIESILTKGRAITPAEWLRGQTTSGS